MGRADGSRWLRCIPAGTLVIASWGCGDTAGPEVENPVIVFEWLRDGNRDIYRAGLDGRDTVRLTTDPGDDQHPTVGGPTVVFTSYGDGNGELYAVDAAGGPARRLTATTDNETEPALSRSGNELAFISDAGGTPKLWISSPDGGNPQRLVSGSFGFPGSPEVSPSWSPAGDRLVFVATPNGSADLFVVAATPGSAPRALVTGSGADLQPAWSPGGDDVAFVSDRDGDVELYLVSVESGVVRRLTDRPGIDAEPAWLPDGRLVFTAWVDGTPRLRWLNPAGPAGAGDVNLAVEGAPRHAAAVFQGRP
jgi:TolB protein